MKQKIKYDKKFLAKLKSNYFNAKVLYETIKENSEEIQRKVLAENKFYETEEIAEMENRQPERILDPNSTYMMDFKDFTQFLDLCYPEYVKAGIADPRGKEYIPEAEEKELYLEAEKQLIDYAIEIIPDKFSEEKEMLKKAVQMIKYKDKVLNLVLKLECDEIENYFEI